MNSAILAAVQREVALSPDALRLWQVCADFAERNGMAKEVAAHLGIHNCTLTTNLARRGLPSVKLMLSHLAFCYGAGLFEREPTASRVAYSLGWNTLQAWGRHLKSYHGMRPSRMRDEVPFPMARERLLNQLVRPYVAGWAAFSFFGNRAESHAARERMAA
jgi:hypothetical protein